MKNKTDLLDPTPAQIKHRNRLWAKALLQNDRKARGEMYNVDGGRCCLAVAQDVAIEHGALDASLRKEDCHNFPHANVCSFFGWKENNPKLNVNVGGQFVKEGAASLNDGDTNFAGIDIENSKIRYKGLSHKQIAECVLNTFVRPSEPKQSFKVK